MELNRRNLLAAAGMTITATVMPRSAGAQSFGFKPNQRYPDPSIEILDPSFLKYRLYSSTVEQVATGMRWCEGPAYFPEEGYLLFSDIPNNRIMKYSEKDGSLTVFRSPSNFANGNTRDRQGRLVTCEHSVTRRITRTEKNGKVTVLADKYEGKRLNAPNDIVVKSDDTIWFSDPLFGILGNWEGNKEKPEQATTNVYRIGTDGKLTAVIFTQYCVLRCTMRGGERSRSSTLNNKRRSTMNIANNGHAPRSAGTSIQSKLGLLAKVVRACWEANERMYVTATTDAVTGRTEPAKEREVALMMLG
jgi:hypothetical protein